MSDERRETPGSRGNTNGSGSLLLEISTEMVKLYKKQFGRGPTKAKTAWADDDTLLCTLEDSFTPAERNLAEVGEHQRLRDVRLLFQYSTEQMFRETVERITSRKIRAFVSGVDTEQDLSIEVFYLEPRADS